MKRTRRHKFLQISVLFLIYSIIHVYSQHLSLKSNTKRNAPITKTDDDIQASYDKVQEKFKSLETELEKIKDIQIPTSDVEIDKSKDNKSATSNARTDNKTASSDAVIENSKDNNKTASSNVIDKLKDVKNASGHVAIEKLKDVKTSDVVSNTRPEKNDSEVVTSTTSTTTESTKTVETQRQKPTLSGRKNLKTGIEKIKASTTLPTTTEEPEFNTLRPRRNCTVPAIEQFPRPLMGPPARKHGGIIIHILVAVYTFFGLAIVCDEYFVASLDRICEELKLSPDVAGATFMAAGSSAPELATVIIGVFLAQDDIGISGVIGSAVFNIMFVISVCALCTNTVCYLNWWPLVRDCFFYAVSILVMLMTIYNDMISWGESLFMLFMYVVYCVVLHFNPQLERWAQTLPVPCKIAAPEEESGLVSYKTLEEDKKRSSYGSPVKNEENAEQDFGGLSGPALNQAQTNRVPSSVPDYYRPREQNPNYVDPMIKPTDGTLYEKISWAVVFPIHYAARKTMPDCKSERFKNWYPFTFLISMIWISFYSYFMVWMITIIGTTLEIPDTVMGLTFVAAGVSVPDALSSIAVLKEGYGDMAVSNAVGSNVFDILVCLGLPWFIQTAIIKPGSHVNVISKGLTYSTLSLLSTVVFLVGATHLNGWKLDRKLGIILMIWYLIFITFASMYEMNIFGELNPPECGSEY